MKKFTSNIRRVIALGCTATLLSCSNYYKAIPTGTGDNADKVAAIEKMSKVNRYFILRNGQQSYSMTNIVISNDKKLLQCILAPVAPKHQLHLKNGRGENMRYKPGKPRDQEVITEAHLFIQADSVPATGKYSLPLDKIQKIEMLGHDYKRTQQSYTIGGVGFALLGIGILAGTIATFSGLSGL